jgi:hypothetical protein
MSSNLKFPPEGLKPSECKKGKSVARSPILFVPPLDLIKKQEIEQIKVKMPNGTNFGMAAFAYGTKEDYIVHIITVLRIIKKKGLASEIKVAWDAILKVRWEMKPYFQYPEDETEAAKEIRKQTLSKYKEILKTKKGYAIAKTQKAYEMFRCFLVGNPQTQWDKIVHKMHTKDPWTGVNGSSNKGICFCSWPSFLDCIELYKLIIIPVDAAEKQHYYMTQTVKKPQRATVRQYMTRMGILNDYLVKKYARRYLYLTF